MIKRLLNKHTYKRIHKLHLKKMASSKKPKKSIIFQNSKLFTTLFFVILFTIPALLLLHTPKYSNCVKLSSHNKAWSGDLRAAEFSWNRLNFSEENPPPMNLKIAVFSRKWPHGATPGGMERHAHTLHMALARRGHRVHVFTSPPRVEKNVPSMSQEMMIQAEETSVMSSRTPWHEKTDINNRVFSQIKISSSRSVTVHWHEGEPGKWRYNKAWEQFLEEDNKEPFDVIHSESVAIPYYLARNLSNLIVSWHGIALESVQSSIYQDLIRKPNEPMSPSFNKSLQAMIPKVLNEIKFFQNYAHHVAISDSCGEMLRGVYQIPTKRVHVIINGVDEFDFVDDSKLGFRFRSKIGVPQNSRIVLGVAGRLVKDKGHPLLYEAFSKLKDKHPNVYLVVAGSGPWLQRYKDLGPNVITLGSMSPFELRAFYNSIDIFVDPTLRPQGLDLTLMEAMMSGKPIMASRFASIKGTIIVDDEFGHLFSPNVDSLFDALELVVLEGSKRLAQRGKACRNYAISMFTASKMALAYERLFLCIKNESFCLYP